MKVRDKILNELYQVELSEINVKLGLIQNIEADLKTWSGATESVKTALGQLASKLIKDNNELKLVFTAIDKVERAASEIGADPIVKEAQRLRKEALVISKSLLVGADKIKEAISVL